MRTVPFTVDLSEKPLDETTLSWPDHPVRLVGARAELQFDLTGENPAWIYIAGGGNVAAFLFHPPCFAGSVRVCHTLDQQPIVLEARQELKVWGVRCGGGGVFRVEVDYVRHRGSRKAAVARPGDRTARLAALAGSR